MPLFSPSSYSPPPFFSHGHVQTIFPALFRKVHGVSYQRERISTPDDDFLDLDWSTTGANRLAILSHGLEGNSNRSYILGMARALNRRGWDALAWNFRGCSGEPNRSIRFYHSGATEDLHAVVAHVEARKSYAAIVLIGFSMGGNITLKYLGERSPHIAALKAAVAFSVPCDLRAGSIKMAEFSNTIYMIRFLRTLHHKIRNKMRLMPAQINDIGYRQIKTFQQFDDRYTAPLHGFENAQDYYRKASCKQFLKNISIPALLINARNDPFLAPSCFPLAEAQHNPNLYLEIPESGGHVGFIDFNPAGEYWSEQRAMQFIEV
ncbi:YheT family hydrolase [Desulfoferrobacter suflitae]|uniref:YheT family hydrolase n=1 Tax=Desulfoferrobacter suflitae TaxID=2865782 RepID=UPI002164CE6D|nr:alpha/beta fold hydrolase [Desulfoferrobacter suflitae]MCK8602770.1 alpha/beta fold hydrolase [Desulfoferrobacter suflitae]